MTTDTGSFSINHLAQTHEVFNQSRPLADFNAYQHDTALQEGVQRHGAGWAQESLLQHGARCGDDEPPALVGLVGHRTRFAEHIFEDQLGGAEALHVRHATVF